MEVGQSDMDGLLQILLFGGAMFLMMKFGCGSHMSGHSHGKDKDGKSAAHGGGCCGGGKKKNTVIESTVGKDMPPKQDSDPVCGQTVFTDRAKTSLYNGLVYFFCSNECREMFEDSPDKYQVNENETQPKQLEDDTAKNTGHA